MGGDGKEDGESGGTARSLFLRNWTAASVSRFGNDFDWLNDIVFVCKYIATNNTYPVTSSYFDLTLHRIVWGRMYRVSFLNIEFCTS